MEFAHDFPAGFTWRDGDRMVRFGPDALTGARDFLRGHGWERYELVSTRRALASASVELAGDAENTHDVRPGAVAEIAAELVDDVRVPTLVAIGGGRVIDVAKAIAAVRGGRVCAIPTTLSGAEMTGFHRLPDGHSAPHLVRPALVCADPQLMTGLPEHELRATAMNALAHGADSLYTPLANPISRIAALDGARLIAAGLDADPADDGRDSLALGSLLCGYAVDSALFAIHHVVCQSLVRVLEIPHAETNATMLPRIMEAMRSRAPEAIDALAESIGAEPNAIGARIDRLSGGPRRLSELGADEARLDAALDAILERGELGMTPDPPGRDELREIIASAW